MSQKSSIKPIKPGLYPDLSNEDYHKDKAIGSSGIKEFAECPALYEYKYLSGKYKNDESKFSMIGTYAHVALLEPHLFEKNYMVSPENAVVNKGKSNEKTVPMNKTHGDWKKFAEEADDHYKRPLLYSEFEQAKAMAEAISLHDLASAMLTGGRAEMSFFAEDPETGLMMKARPDYVVKIDTPKVKGFYIIDYKTTALSLGTSKQSNHAFNLGRHIQASHHKKVTELATKSKIAGVVYITQMQEAPHLIRVFIMPEEAIEMGDMECRRHLDAMAQCHATGVWPDYPHEIEYLIIPRWMDYEFN